MFVLLVLRGKKAEKLRHEENWVHLTPNSNIFPTQLNWGPSSSSSLETSQHQYENEVRMSMKCLVPKNCHLIDARQFQCNPQMKRTGFLFGYRKSFRFFFVTKQGKYLMTSEESIQKESMSFCEAEVLKVYLCGWHHTKPPPES